MYIIDYKYIITEQKKYINFTEMYRKAYPELKKKKTIVSGGGGGGEVG